MSTGIQSTQDGKWICATCGQPEDECGCEVVGRMSAEKCPVCNGTGKVYVFTLTGTMPTEVCYGCGGRGWVETHKSDPSLVDIYNLNAKLPLRLAFDEVVE